MLGKYYHESIETKKKRLEKAEEKKLSDTEVAGTCSANNSIESQSGKSNALWTPLFVTRITQ